MLSVLPYILSHDDPQEKLREFHVSKKSCEARQISRSTSFTTHLRALPPSSEKPLQGCSIFDAHLCPNVRTRNGQKPFMRDQQLHHKHYTVRSNFSILLTLKPGHATYVMLSIISKWAFEADKKTLFNTG
jgi:hypothetical protein